MSYCTSNKGSVINKQTSLINNSNFLIHINSIYNQVACDTKISCFLNFKKNRTISKIQGTKTCFDFKNFV